MSLIFRLVGVVDMVMERRKGGEAMDDTDVTDRLVSENAEAQDDGRRMERRRALGK